MCQQDMRNFLNVDVPEFRAPGTLSSLSSSDIDGIKSSPGTMLSPVATLSEKKPVEPSDEPEGSIGFAA